MAKEVLKEPTVVKESPKITIGIKEIRIPHWEMTNRMEQIKEFLPDNSFEFQFDMHSEINGKEKLFTLNLQSRLYEKQNEVTKLELAKLNVSISFIIVNFEEVIKINEGKVSSPNQLVIITAGVMISTVRGIFASKLQDTFFSNAIVPIIDPQIFLPKAL